MGVRFFFHLILLLTFAGLLGLDYYNTTSAYQKLVNEQATKYRQTLNSVEAQASGSSLFNELQQSFNFAFFQYVDQEDGDFNYTYGSLATNSDRPFYQLFPLQNNIRDDILNGKLQVLLGHPEQTQTLYIELRQSAVYLIVAYLFLVFTFTLSMMMLKRRINYAAAYIGQLPKFQFNSVESSKLVGLLSPLAGALDNCRRDLKLKMDEVASEQDKLSKVAFQDPLTGFGSAQRFARKLDILAEEGKPRLGLLAHIKATELANINQEKGHQAGDNYLLKVANAIRRSVSSNPEAECFRFTSGDFAVYVPDMPITQAMDFFGELKTEFNDCQQELQTDSVAYTGIVPCPSGCNPSNVLSMADTAVSIALTQSPNTIHVLEKAPDTGEQGEDQWQEILQTMIGHKAIGFYAQPIQPCNSDTEGYRELLARFYNHAGNVLPTQTVLAMSKRYGLCSEIDKTVISCYLDMLSRDKTLTGSFGINLNGASINNNDFLSWLKTTLMKHSNLAARLVFELPENNMQSNLLASTKFVKLAHSLGVRVAVDHFGQGFTSFKFFREVRPDYIKLDGSYSHRIDEDGNNRFYVRTLVDIARRGGIQVIASTVERQEEKVVLEKLLVDGLQGFYIARPQAIGGKQIKQ